MLDPALDAPPAAAGPSENGIDPKRLEEPARALARTQALASKRLAAKRRYGGLPRLFLREVYRGLPEAYRALADAARRGATVSPAAEWLLDNFYLIRAQVQQVREDLPWTFYRTLPRLDRGPYRGLPRIYELIQALAGQVDNAVDEDNLYRFAAAYQETTPLLLGELWALPSMLRLALLERLGTLAGQVVDDLGEQQAAVTWAGQIAAKAADDDSEVVFLLAAMAEQHAPFSGPFVVALATALQAHGAVGAPALDWLDRRLRVRRLSLDEIMRREAQRQAHLRSSVANAVNALRRAGERDWAGLVERLSVVEAALRHDPAGVYAQMDFPTRDDYRHRVEELARYGPASELSVAERAVALAEAAAEAAEAPGVASDDAAPSRAAHVGYYLVGGGAAALAREVSFRPPVGMRLRRWARRHPGPAYAGVLVSVLLGLMAGAFLLASEAGAETWAVALAVGAAFIPGFGLAIALTNWGFTRLLPPTPLPKLAFREGIPEADRTFVVVPTLLTGPADARAQVDRLEVQALANPDPQLRFALLTDFTDAPAQHQPGDEATLAAARRAVQALNARHADALGDKFFLLHRERRWNPQEGIWMGWERKRGKLEEFNRLLRLPDAGTSYVEVEGDFRAVAAGDAVRYVITLDADTQLPPRAATDLVRTAAHPLNRPVYSVAEGRVVRGYGVLQPRVGIRAEAGFRTRFSRLFSGNVGVDPYTSAVSDLYQDLFGEGIFTGKGLYGVDVFRATLDGAVPEDAVLSHDLLEGLHARTALVTDVLLFDDYPSRYAAFAKRLHRWVRGDWQIHPWLFPIVPAARGRWRRNPIPLLGRWMIFDNLRRSLTAPALLVFLLLAWTVMPGPALLWTLLAVGAIAFPIYAPFTSAMLAHPRDAVWSSYFLGALADARQSTLQVALSVTLLAHEALLMLDAIGRTLWRMLRGRRLLEWVTANQAEQSGGDAPGIWFSPLWGAVTAALVLALKPTALPLALPFVAAWLAAPWIARWTGRPTPRHEYVLTDADRAALRETARRTWRFFDDFLREEDHFLPPDNFQEQPYRGIARRTSPTNIGLGLLAVQTAVDFGYVTREDGLARLERMLDALEAMERYRGHFFNWYDTATLEPLVPRYVSTVDSGNLVGALLTLKQALGETPHAAVYSPALFDGLRDGLGALDDALARPRRDPESTRAVRDALARFRDALDAPVDAAAASNGGPDLAAHRARLAALLEPAQSLEAAAAALDFRSETDRVEIQYWAGQPLRRLRAEQAMLDRYAPPAGASSAQPDEESDGKPDGALTFGALRAAAEVDASGDGAAPPPGPAAAADALLRRADALANRAERLARDHDFRPLFRARIGLFAIGYNADTGELDESSYNLLASEARLASLLAIARGDVPPRHWFRLSRPTTTLGGDHVLVSWSGTMFEYLMPLLLTQTYESSLLGEACDSAVAVQRRYARKRGHPWGISESAYFGLDLHLTYQYRAFGVPGLGLKRGLAEDDVVAPYATALALMVQPGAALRNLERLREAGAYGPYGYYDAVDYTKKRLPPDQPFAVVATYMAHHQGMSLLAIQNVLDGNRVQQRFHREPLVRSVEALLQEQAPRRIEKVPLPDEMEEIEPVTPHTVTGASRRIGPEQLADPAPHVHLLAGGRLSTLVTAAGAGYVHFDGFAVTRWRPDRTREADGPFLYVQDLDSGRLWSAGVQPTAAVPESYEVWFHTGRAEFVRLDDGIELRTEIALSPEDDVEVRRYTLVNRSGRPRRLALTSYAEVVLYPPEADLAHPAFSKLFVHTEAAPEHHAVLATRRPRGEHDRRLWLFHSLADDDRAAVKPPPTFETDRAAFVGRGRTLAHPAALGQALAGGVGPVLDPVVSLRRTVDLPPQGRATVSFATGVAETREDALKLADRYDHPAAAARALELAEVYALVELQHLGLTGRQALHAQHLASSLLYGHPALRAAESVLLRSRRAQAGLWAYGVSGDLPILVFRINKTEQVPALRVLLRMHAFWRTRGLLVDLVVFNEHAASYADELQHGIHQEVSASPSHGMIDQRGGIFVRRREGLPEEDVTLILSAARVVLDGAFPPMPADGSPDGGQFPHGLLAGPSAPRAEAAPPAAPADASEDLSFFNGYGGFSPDGAEYVIRLPATTGAAATPLPWTNVVANERFGFTATERGGGYSWYRNSQQNKLTPWSNDPVLDPLGEALYLRDEDTDASWLLPPRDGAAYEVRHGWGYTVYRHERDGLAAEATLFVPREDPVKVIRVRLTNTGAAPHRLALYRYQRWAMDENERKSRPFIRVRTDLGTNALFARNPYAAAFSPYVAFADAARLDGEAPGEDPMDGITYTADRTAFVGRLGSEEAPAAVRLGGPLDERIGAGLDPCAAFRVPVELAPGASAEVVFLLGQADTREEARALVRRYRRPEAVASALDAVRAFWRETLTAVQVETPAPRLDTLVNGWLLYQNLACRLWGRSAFYQSGGAFGFRDQIQDSLALVFTRPDLTRAQILLHAAHQFVEGDVLHWWHTETGAGIRSRFSDDLLWLPYAMALYVRATGDAAVLDEEVRFLTARPLEPGEDEAYLIPDEADETATLFEHACRALDRSLTAGRHGLPLMGSGDWNDGMNRVGNEGEGESVWLGFFLVHILDEVVPLAEARGEDERTARYRDYRARLAEALNADGWDGAWYRRAFYDDGTPLGSKINTECRIDAIAQGWSVISGVATDARAERALGSAEALLIDEAAGLIRLLTPPFDKTEHDPGYIKGYLPGVRENGGQYTHGALWLIRAFAERGHGTRAAELLRMITPLAHGDSPEEVAVFQTEPYAVAADVYAVPPHVGRGGWTWYTGSAGWMYRVAVESLLGMTVEGGDTLVLDPRIPRGWPGFSLRYRPPGGEAVYAVRVENPEGVQRGVLGAEVDGEAVEIVDGAARIPLVPDGRRHAVVVRLGAG